MTELYWIELVRFTSLPKAHQNTGFYQNLSGAAAPGLPRQEGATPPVPFPHHSPWFLTPPDIFDVPPALPPAAAAGEAAAVG